MKDFISSLIFRIDLDRNLFHKKVCDGGWTDVVFGSPSAHRPSSRADATTSLSAALCASRRFGKRGVF